MEKDLKGSNDPAPFKEKYMKKFVIALVALAALSFAAAQSVTLGVNYHTDLGAVVEYSHDVEDFGAVLLGVRVAPVGFATEVFGGVGIHLFTLEGEDTAVFSLPLLVHLPVYDGQTLILGQLDFSAGVEMFVPNTHNNLGLVFNVAGRTPVSVDALAQLPSLSLGAGLRYSF